MEWSTSVGTVSGLYRFPIKSTAGEALSSAPVGERGLLHDREWAVYTGDGGIASGKTTRRFRKVEDLLSWRSTVRPTDDAGDEAGDGQVLLHSPEGDSYPVDDPATSRVLSRALGQLLTLQRESAVRHHDECAVHVLTTSSLRRVEQLVGARLDVRRLRANVVLDTEGAGFVEDAWTDADLALGPDVVLRLGPSMRRCVMVDQPQAHVAADPSMLRTLGDAHDVLLGLQAHVVRTGTVRIEDPARIVRR